MEDPNYYLRIWENSVEKKTCCGFVLNLMIYCSLSTLSYTVLFEQVILVSSSGQASSSSILHQKSITVPVVKTTSSLGGTHNQKSSNILPNSGGSSNTNLGNIVTMATSMSSSATASRSKFTHKPLPVHCV